ncbi:hypothetical protein C8T65DRAFT_650614 [Cerioporus squamosus]|nr:hypothetical protein C8T65DRAFT_650614 [Cerioporus squamosus]
MPLPVPLPVPIRQPISPLEDRPRLSCSNRGVTVRQLALELPMSRARSGSLSTLIHALEDASPGWYESLMDNALPQSGSSILSYPVNVPSTKAPRPPLRRRNEGAHSSAPLDGLPDDMLVDLAELEALALTVGRLPIPRPRTMALEVAATALFSSSVAPPLPSRHVSSRSPHLTPLEEERERQLTVRYAATVQTQERHQHVDSASSSPRSEQHDYSCASRDAIQPAITNLAHHPKLTKTLGMRSSLPAASRFLAPAPRTPSWRAGRHSAIPRVSTQTTTRAHPPPLPQEDMKAPQKAPQTPHKTQKQRNLHSLFRRRPSAPPMPMQPPELGGSPVRSMAKRAAHLSEPVMRPLHAPGGDSLLGKSGKNYDTASDGPYSLQPLSPLGSFLPM